MSLDMGLWGRRALGFSSSAPETRAGLAGEGDALLLWKKGLVTKERKWGEADSAPD